MCAVVDSRTMVGGVRQFLPKVVQQRMPRGAENKIGKREYRCNQWEVFGFFDSGSFDAKIQ